METTAPVLFKRTALTAPLVRPSRDGNIDALWDMVNVSEADRPLLVALLVAALNPDESHVIANLTGEQGTGKSTATKIIASIIDPSTVPLRHAPRNNSDWTISASGSWVVPLDNLSKLPEWLSDALCRASTGDGDAKRLLYSNDDLHVTAFRRQVLLNGIDIAGIKDDLADRLVTIELRRIPDSARVSDETITKRWQETWPIILGGLLDLTVEVMRRKSSLKPEGLPRMADYAHTLATVDAILGTNGVETYKAQAADSATDAVEADPVVQTIESWMVATEKTEWTDGIGALLDGVKEHLRMVNSPDWPEDARELGRALTRKAPSMRKAGWEVEKTTKRGRRGAVWHLKRPAPPEQA